MAERDRSLRFSVGEVSKYFVEPKAGLDDLKMTYDVDFTSIDAFLGQGCYGRVTKAYQKASVNAVAIKEVDTSKFTDR